MEAFHQSVGEVTAPASAPSVGGHAEPIASRDGAISVGDLVIACMAAYAGRDVSRVQRLSY